MDRCDWVTNALLANYHDTEWGLFTFNDKTHFEHICLSGFQAGLSWEIVLKKRNYLRILFSNFEPRLIAQYDKARIEKLFQDPRGIRNSKKIYSVINNAKAFLSIQDRHASFSKFVFANLNNKRKINHYKNWRDIPPFAKESIKISKLMKGSGFTFFGPTIAYAYMQSIGFVDDHTNACFKKQTCVDMK